MENCRKDGFIRNIQRYKCKECNFRHTVQKKSTAAPLSVKRHALQLYLEGLGFRAIGRVLNFSYVSVYNWIKSFGEQLKNLKSENKIKQKNYRWIWIAVDRVKKKYIDFIVGQRDIDTGQKLWSNVEKKEIGNVFSDYYKAYKSLLKKETHIQSKAETYTVEGYNIF